SCENSSNETLITREPINTPQIQNLHILVNKTQTRTSLPYTLKLIKLRPLASHCSGCLIKNRAIVTSDECNEKVTDPGLETRSSVLQGRHSIVGSRPPPHCTLLLVFLYVTNEIFMTITEKAKIIIVVRQDFMLNAILTDDTLTIELSDV
ncbi:hypothetical protein TSAR_014359, partial [Trichomalopsis sarcophagae]